MRNNNPSKHIHLSFYSLQIQPGKCQASPPTTTSLQHATQLQRNKTIENETNNTILEKFYTIFSLKNIHESSNSPNNHKESPPATQKGELKSERKTTYNTFHNTLVFKSFTNTSKDTKPHNDSIKI